MGLSLIIVQKIAVMFVLVLVGFLCAKAGMIDRETNKKLSALALRLVTPMLIFSSYQVEYEWRLVRNLLFSFAMAALAYAVQMPPDFAAVLFRDFCTISPELKQSMMTMPEFNTWLSKNGRFFNR